MGKKDVDHALRALAVRLESDRCKLDKDIASIYAAIRINNVQGDDSITARVRSGFAQELTDVMYEILQAERPLHRNDILSRVKERGIHIGGQKPINSIGSYLSTDARFKNVSRGTWTLTVDPSTPSDNGLHGELVELGKDAPE